MRVRGTSGALGPIEGDEMADYRIAVDCAACLRKHAATTTLAILEHAPFGDQHWRWIRVGRAGNHDGRIAFALPTDPGSSSLPRRGGAEFRCQRCGARPRISFARLRAEAEAVRIAGASVLNL